MIRVLVTGSRDWTDTDRIHVDLWAFDHNHDGPITLVHGACPSGADPIAADFAADLGWILEPHAADWETYGKSAGPRRNREMVDAGAVVCFAYLLPWPKSRGSAATADMAEAAGIKVMRRTA